MMFECPGNRMSDLSRLPLYLKGPWVTTAGSRTLRPGSEAVRMAPRHIPLQMADLPHLPIAGQLTLSSQRPSPIPFRNTLEQRNTLSTFWELSLGYLELGTAEPCAAAPYKQVHLFPTAATIQRVRMPAASQPSF